MRNIYVVRPAYFNWEYPPSNWRHKEALHEETLVVIAAESVYEAEGLLDSAQECTGSRIVRRKTETTMDENAWLIIDEHMDALSKSSHIIASSHLG